MLASEAAEEVGDLSILLKAATLAAPLVSLIMLPLAAAGLPRAGLNTLSGAAPVVRPIIIDNDEDDDEDELPVDSLSALNRAEAGVGKDVLPGEACGVQDAEEVAVVVLVVVALLALLPLIERPCISPLGLLRLTGPVIDPSIALSDLVDIPLLRRGP